MYKINYIYIYVHTRVCACVCVSVWVFIPKPFKKNKTAVLTSVDDQEIVKYSLVSCVILFAFLF